MQWLKRGIVWCPDGNQRWARSHAMCPTPTILDEGTLRIYVTCLDSEGRGSGVYVDVSAEDPNRVLGVSSQPVLEPGEPGAFDDNGVIPLSIVQENDAYYMYYAGFEICKHIRYRIFTGLAKSIDGGKSFLRHSKTPILDRTDGELFFRSGSFALKDDKYFKLWYVAGNSWTEIDGKSMPVYDLRYAESEDGATWPNQGALSLGITAKDEHGFGRPWIIRRADGSYQLFYSIRRRSLGAYRLGYAESADGVTWVRKDNEMGLDVTPSSFDSDAIMYAAVISIRDKTYCFYNGNEFGKDGFAVAELLN